MSKRSEKRALEAIPNVAGPYDVMSNADKRKVFIRGYEQAEKDLALTWEDVKQIAMISVELSRKRFDDFYVHQTISDEEHFSDVLKRFNEQRKK